MPRPSKPMAKNSNSKFTPRNDKQDIFSKMGKVVKPKTDVNKKTEVDEKPETDGPGATDIKK